MLDFSVLRNNKRIKKVDSLTAGLLVTKAYALAAAIWLMMHNTTLPTDARINRRKSRCPTNWKKEDKHICRDTIQSSQKQTGISLVTIYSLVYNNENYDLLIPFVLMIIVAITAVLMIFRSVLKRS